MDITETTAPKSDQQSFEDFPLGMTRIVTVTAVNRNSDDQPVNVELAEFPGRPFRPNKSMRRVLRDVWGADTNTYVGKRLELFGNPDVMWGGKKVGGVQIKAMSDIDSPKSVQLTVTKGTRGKFTVQPLAAPKARDWDAELTLAGDNLDAIAALGKATSDAHADTATVQKIRDEWTRVKSEGEVI